MGGREGVGCGRPHQGQRVCSGYTLPAVMHCWWDAQAPVFPLLLHHLHPPALITVPPASQESCCRAAQKLWHQSRGRTVHMKPYTQLMVTNVFSKKSQVSRIHHRLTLLVVHVCTHILIAYTHAHTHTAKNVNDLCYWTERLKKNHINVEIWYSCLSSYSCGNQDRKKDRVYILTVTCQLISFSSSKWWTETIIKGL